MKTPNATCCVDHCDNAVTLMKSLGVCTTCYHAMYYWTNPKNRKTPADILRYRRRLLKFQARMETLQPQIKTLIPKQREMVHVLRKKHSAR